MKLISYVGERWHGWNLAAVADIVRMHQETPDRKTLWKHEELMTTFRAPSAR